MKNNFINVNEKYNQTINWINIFKTNKFMNND